MTYWAMIALVTAFVVHLVMQLPPEWQGFVMGVGLCADVALFIEAAHHDQMRR